MTDRRARDYATELLVAIGLAGVSIFVFKTFVAPYLSNLVDPDREKKENARLRAKAHIDRLRAASTTHLSRDRSGAVHDEDAELHYGSSFEDMNLNEYENTIAMDMVAASDIPVGFSDIAGLDDIIDELREAVIYPLMMPQLYAHASSLLSAPLGVLLYGPPGCGKTMLAKAVARESGASFINLHISTVTEKWYGDSNKLVHAVFSLARKVQPAIIFIDEVDAVLGTRRSGEHEATSMVKAEFMTLWDGLVSTNAMGKPARIVVLGATNRINDIDEAILRRMPKKFAVPLPGVRQRSRLLQLILHDTKKDPAEFDLDYIASIMAGMSGSDIKEACRDAAMTPVREHLRQHYGNGGNARSVDPSKIRPLRNSDFFGRLGGGMAGIQDPTRPLPGFVAAVLGETSDGGETAGEESSADMATEVPAGSYRG